MEKDYFFRELDKQIINTDKFDMNVLQGYLSSFSNHKFLGYCCLAPNRLLEMNPKEEERCQFLMTGMAMEKIYFGLFSMTYIKNGGGPERGQNYDTNHIVRFQHRLFELQLKQANRIRRAAELTVNPIKLTVLNLVDTQTIQNKATMSSYDFLDKGIVNQIDSIAQKVRLEILKMTEKRERYFEELRNDEKEFALLLEENNRLKRKYEEARDEFSKL